MASDDVEPYAPEFHPEVAVAASTATDDGAKMFAAKAAGMIQDHVARQAAVEQAHASAEQLQSNVANTRDQLVDMVRGSPSSAPLAFQLADHFATGIGASHPNEGEVPEVQAGLASHFNSEIAKATIQGWAGINPDIARAAIDRYSEHLNAGEAGDLHNYVNGMETLGIADAAAAKITQAHNLVQQSNFGTMAYMSQLTDPATGALSFPPGWGQKMMQDERIAPDAKAALYQGYSNLQTNGEPYASNPGVVSDLLHRSTLPYNHPDHPLTPEVASHLGANLTLADAQFLASRIGPQTPQMKDETVRLSDALSSARQALGNDHAYGRYANWFLPAYQRATALGAAPADLLDPEKGMVSPGRLAQFRPTGDDIVAPAVKAGPRPSLKDIFGG